MPSMPAPALLALRSKLRYLASRDDGPAPLSGSRSRAGLSKLPSRGGRSGRWSHGDDAQAGGPARAGEAAPSRRSRAKEATDRLGQAAAPHPGAPMRVREVSGW